MKHHLMLAGLIVLAGVMLTACGRSAPAPEEILARSAEAMRQVDSVQWHLVRNGPPIQLGNTEWVIPEGGNILADVTAFTPGGTQAQPEFAEAMTALVAKGVYLAPDTMYVIAKAQEDDSFKPVLLTWTGGQMLIRLSELRYGDIMWPAPATDFNPVDVFNAETGIPYMLTNVLANPSLAGEEELDGLEVYHITAQAEGRDLGRLVGGAVAEGTATVDLWINKSTSQLVRVIVTEADGNSWRLDFCCYGEVVQPLTD